MRYSTTSAGSSTTPELRDGYLAPKLSADLPFAQSRWQTIENVANITMLSDYCDLDFTRNWGLLVQELGLLAQVVYVIDRMDAVTYREIVSKLLNEPNYQAAIEALEVIQTNDFKLRFN